MNFLNIILEIRKGLIYEFSFFCFISYKKILKNLYHLLSSLIFFLSISSVFIAIIGILLPYVTFLLYNINIDLNLLLSSYLLTFTVYSLDKLSNIKEDSVSLPDRAGFIGEYKKILTFITVASYIFALSISFLKNSLAVFIVLFPLFTGLVYSIKISNFRLKDILAIKNISIATSWAVVGTFLPLVDSSKSSMQIVFIFYFIFIKCFINTIIFDIRDIEGDSINNVRTIPVHLGSKKTKVLILILNSTLIFWLIFTYSLGFFRRDLFVLIFAVSYGYWYILHFCKEGIKIGKSFDLLVDGEWIPIAILALIFSRF
jgi:4-hydroxybenzoate polyprenyltransferase